MFHGLSNDFLYSAYKIESIYSNGSQQASSTGTGFFVKNSKGELVLVTNRHVLELDYPVVKTQFSGFYLVQIIITGKTRDQATNLPEVETKLVIDQPKYTVSSNSNNDIACISKLSINQTLSTNPVIDFFIDYEMLATDSDFQSRLGVCDFVAFPGFPPWHDNCSNRPILRTGTLSSDPRYDYQNSTFGLIGGNCLAYEAFSFGGSSGSPIFAVQKGIKPGAGLSFGGFRETKLIGINAGHLRTQKDEHSGISYMFKSNEIIGMIG